MSPKIPFLVFGIFTVAFLVINYTLKLWKSVIILITLGDVYPILLGIIKKDPYNKKSIPNPNTIVC